CSRAASSALLFLGFLLRSRPGRLHIARPDALQIRSQSYAIVVEVSYLLPLLPFLATIAAKVIPKSAMESSLDGRLGKHFLRRVARVVTLRDRKEDLLPRAMCENPFDFLAHPCRAARTA